MTHTVLDSFLLKSCTSYISTLNHLVRISYYLNDTKQFFVSWIYYDNIGSIFENYGSALQNNAVYGHIIKTGYVNKETSFSEINARYLFEKQFSSLASALSFIAELIRNDFE